MIDKSYWDLDDAGKDEYVSQAMAADDAKRALPRDRAEEKLGTFLRSADGPGAFRDSCGDDLVQQIGELAECGDLAAIGTLVVRYMLADKGMKSSMEYQREQRRRQRRLELDEGERSSRMASQLGGDIGYVIGGLR